MADAAAIGRAQARSWRDAYRDILSAAMIAALDADELAARWADSLRRPPAATHRALVALDANAVVGFAATGPCDDPDADPIRDAEMTVLVVDPDHVGQGHGSRLLAAVADTARADGFTRATTWVFSTDDAMRAFLSSAGWAADGAHREIVPDADDAEAAPIGQVRMHTSLEE